MTAADFEADLLKGIAQLLQTEGIGTWKESASYTAAETGIVIDATPETLSRAIQLSTYGVTDDEEGATDVVGLQIMVRWEGASPLPSRALDSKIFNALQGRSVLLATGVQINNCRRASSASLGIDGSKRWTRSSNYYVTVYRPGAYRS